MTAFAVDAPRVTVTGDRPTTRGDRFESPLAIMGTSGAFTINPQDAGPEDLENDVRPYSLVADETVWIDYLHGNTGVLSLVQTAGPDSIVEGGSGLSVDSFTPFQGGSPPSNIGVGAFMPTKIRIRPALPGTAAPMTFTWSFVDTVPDLVVVALSKLQQAPGTFRVTVTNGVPNATVTFTDSNFDVIDDATLDENGTLISHALAITTPVNAGTYVLTAASAGRDPATTNFVIVNDPLSDPTGQPIDADPVLVAPVGGVQKWVYQDPAPGGLDQYVFAINPLTATSPWPANIFTSDVTTAPDGQFLTWEGATRSVDWSFKGTFLTQDQHDNMVAFSLLQRRFYLIDNRNRAWVVSIENIDLAPRKTPGYPWAHDYTVNAVIYSGPIQLGA